MRFENRIQAGELLADKLLSFKKSSDIVVVALARGGVEIGFSLSQKLHLPLKVLVVRKLGTPLDEELAMGAVTEDGETVINNQVMRSYGITVKEFEAEKAKELSVLRARMEKYLGGKKDEPLENKTVILTDDGIATGSTVKVAINFLRRQKVKKIILAVPVAPRDTEMEINSLVDKMLILYIPEYFGAVGQFYKNFNQVTDDEVIDYLNRSKQPRN
ncbi:MAG: phosphoribosyltransferase [Fusobacteriaceae bacterium]